MSNNNDKGRDISNTEIGKEFKDFLDNLDNKEKKGMNKLKIAFWIIILSAIGFIFIKISFNSHDIGSSKVSTYPIGILPPVPGVINPDITQANIKQNICAGSAWSTKSIRPSTAYTNPIKIQKMKEAGMTMPTSEIELDHAISLQLGGSPTDPNNLWAQPYSISYKGELLGARQKDVVESILKREVCDGTLTLTQAQHEIITDWVSVYESSKGKVGSAVEEIDQDDN